MLSLSIQTIEGQRDRDERYRRECSALAAEARISGEIFT